MPDSKNLLRNIAKRKQQGGGPFAITCWKAHPTIWPNSGMRFPVGAPGGNCDPEFRLRMGYSFPNRVQPETATQFEASKRDAVSARPTLAAIPSFSGRHQQLCSQKIYEQLFDAHISTCAFSVEKTLLLQKLNRVKAFLAQRSVPDKLLGCDNWRSYASPTHRAFP